MVYTNPHVRVDKIQSPTTGKACVDKIQTWAILKIGSQTLVTNQTWDKIPRAGRRRIRFLRTVEIPICVSAYNGNPYIHSCVQLKSLYALLRATEIRICVTAYNGNPYMRYCVQWKSLDALLRTMENPYMRHCVQWKSLYALPVSYTHLTLPTIPLV